MEIICQFCSCVYRLVAFSFVLHEIHFLQDWEYLINRIFIVKFPLQIAVYDQRDEACNEVGKYPVLTVQIYGTGFKVGLHYPEAFFDLITL